MIKLIISHKNACNGVIPDGYLIYDHAIFENNNIVEFYSKGQLVARLRGEYDGFENTLELDDTIFEDEEEELIYRG